MPIRSRILPPQHMIAMEYDMNKESDQLVATEKNKTIDAARKLIQQKHEQYLKSALISRTLYYTLRLTIGLSAGLLPFIIQTQPIISTALSLLIVIGTTIDSIFDPKTKWQIYSKSTDLLALAALKKSGEYEEYKESLETIFKTESEITNTLEEVETLLNKINKISTPLQKSIK